MSLRKVTTDWDLIKDTTHDLSYNYTIIIYEQKKELGLTFSEYCVLDYINQGSRMHMTDTGWVWNPHKPDGYCIAKVETIAEGLGLHKVTTHRILKKFKDKKWIAQNGAGLALSIPWKTGRDAWTEKTSYNKFVNTVRKTLKLTFLEYATLLYLEQLILKSPISLTTTGERVTTKSKKEIGEGVGEIDSRVMRKIVKRLEDRDFLRNVRFKGNRTAIYLKIDMASAHLYAVDEDEILYLPSRTTLTENVYAQ